MHTLFHDCFNPKNSRENHRQIALFTASIFTGFALGLFRNDYPRAALLTIFLGLVLVGIKTTQMMLTPPEEETSTFDSYSPV